MRHLSDLDLRLVHLQQSFKTCHELAILYPEDTRQRQILFESMNLIRSEVSERFGYEEMLKLNTLIP